MAEVVDHENSSADLTEFQFFEVCPFLLHLGVGQPLCEHCLLANIDIRAPDSQSGFLRLSLALEY